MNYKESQIVGTEYQRARLVEIHNQKDVLPHIAFIEEMITVLPNRTLSAPVGQISTQYNPTRMIELHNPETGDPIIDGNGAQMVMSQQMVMLAIHSLYMQLVRQRDAANAPVVAIEPEPVQDQFIVPEPVIEVIEEPALEANIDQSVSELVTDTSEEPAQELTQQELIQQETVVEEIVTAPPIEECTQTNPEEPPVVQEPL